MALAERAGGVRAVKGNGFWSIGSGEEKVTWFFGHMFELAEPKAYGAQWEKWSLASLPIQVEDQKWQLVIPDDKKSQVSKVRELAEHSQSIVNCGDAGREGELLVSEAVYEFGIDAYGPNIKRLWVQSMARKDMLAALNNLLPSVDKKGLYDAAVSRQRADWSHGLNFTRLFTLLARNSGANATISVGRVQTPTLRLVVDRDRERLRFKPTDHYLPTIMFRHANGTFRASWVIPADHEGLDSEGRLVDKAVAAAICGKVAGKDGRVRAFKSEIKSKAPPLPFSLSALQSECSAKLGMTAKDVLDTAQSLYEKHRATTYPRSDSRHLPASLMEEVPGVVAALARTPGLEEAACGTNTSLRSAAWDDSKVSDHHAIIPTSEFTAAKLDQMSDTERKVFLIIARGFIAQFYPPFRWRSLSAEVLCEAEQFRGTGRQPVDAGWKKVFGAATNDDDEGGESAQSLPTMAVGDGVTAEGNEITAKRTSAPPAFTDGTLIEAMANCHRFEPNPELKKRLREGEGIGTEATRADTLETLLIRKFMLRKGKNTLESTEFGRSVIDMLPDDLKSLGLTALWDGLLNQIEKGTLDPALFMAKQAQSITERVAKHRGTAVVVKGIATVKPLPGHGKDCTACGKGKLVTREGTSKKDGKKYRCLSCSNYPDCKAVEWPEADVPPLPGHGKECPACGKGKLLTKEITSKKAGPTLGKKYRLLACTNYPECKHGEWPDRPPQADVPPLPGHGKECPACGKGKLLTKEITSKKAGPTLGKKYRLLACTNYPECKHGEWPDRAPQAGVPPLPGHGKECPACGKGKLLTKEITGKKDGKKHTLLACTNYPECRHGEWPDRDGGDRNG